MKKAISVILNVLSGVSAFCLAVLAGFCIYDWIKISNTAFAYSPEFWAVVDYYSKGMMIFSAVGAVLSIPNFFITKSQRTKKISKVLIAVFALILIISIILYFLPFNF